MHAVDVSGPSGWTRGKHAKKKTMLPQRREHALANAANEARKQTRACFVQCQSTMHANTALSGRHEMA